MNNYVLQVLETHFYDKGYGSESEKEAHDLLDTLIKKGLVANWGMKMRMKKVLFFILDWTWCFPQTLLGFILTKTLWLGAFRETGIAREFYVYLSVGLKDWEQTKGKLYAFVSGFSLGRYICVHYQDIYDGDGTVYTIRHECGHTVQSRILGPFYLFVIGIPSVISNLLSRVNRTVCETYYERYPETWAERLGGVPKRRTAYQNYEISR